MAPLPSVRLTAACCITALGNAEQTHAALLRGERALQLGSVLASDGGELAPLALAPSRGLDETAPPNWLPHVKALAAELTDEGWGSPRCPVYVTSSNFGVGSLYAFRRHGNASHLEFGTPHKCVE